MSQRALTGVLIAIAAVIAGTAVLAHLAGCPVTPRQFRSCLVRGVDIAYVVNAVALASIVLFWLAGGYALLWIVVGAATRERESFFCWAWTLFSICRPGRTSGSWCGCATSS